MRDILNYCLSREREYDCYSSYLILLFRCFSGLMMIPYGYGKIVDYDQYAADYFCTGRMSGYFDFGIPNENFCGYFGFQHVGCGKISFFRPFQYKSVADVVFGYVRDFDIVGCG